MPRPLRAFSRKFPVGGPAGLPSGISPVGRNAVGKAADRKGTVTAAGKAPIRMVRQRNKPDETAGRGTVWLARLAKEAARASVEPLPRRIGQRLGVTRAPLEVTVRMGRAGCSGPASCL